jgi:hypothetical protein
MTKAYPEITLTYVNFSFNVSRPEAVDSPHPAAAERVK